MCIKLQRRANKEERGPNRSFRKVGAALLAGAALWGCGETVHYSNEVGPAATDSRNGEPSDAEMDAGPPVPLCEDGHDEHTTLRMGDRVSFSGGYVLELLVSREYDADFVLWDPDGLRMGGVQILEGPDTTLSLPEGDVRFAACTIRPGERAGEGFVLLESDTSFSRTD